MTLAATSGRLCVPGAENRASYPGWRITFICHLAVICGFASVFIYSFSFMVRPLQHEFGWSSEQVARAFSLAVLSVAICSPVVGKLFDRLDPRKLIATFMTAFGLGIASLAFLTPRLSQFYATAVFIGAAGTGTYQLGYARIVAAWFERRLGTALSIVVAGSGVGSFIVPLLVQYLIAAHGWREAYLILAALPLLCGVPITLLFARSPQRSSAHETARAPAVQQANGVSWRSALATFSFWLLAAGVCALSLSYNGALAHLAPMLSNHGLSPRAVALAASLLGVSSLLGRLALGSLLDFFEGSLIALGALLTAGMGMLLAAHARSLSMAAPAVFIAGLGGGCELDLVPYMLRRYFGMRAFSTLYGLTYTAFAGAAAVGPLIVGHVYDSTGSYNGVFNVLCAVTIVAAFAMLALPAYAAASGAGLPQANPAVIPESPLIPKGRTAIESNFNRTGLR
jgi:MFS family permease